MRIHNILNCIKILNYESLSVCQTKFQIEIFTFKYFSVLRLHPTLWKIFPNPLYLFQLSILKILS